MALLSFVRIMIKLQRSPELEKYRRNEKLKEGIPNFTVKLGYGLHIGWGIEVIKRILNIFK